MVDRYDVRLLWHDTMQLSRAVRKRTADASEQALEEELDYERYLDINQPRRSESPPADVSPQTGVVEASEALPEAAYQAVPFTYDISEQSAAAKAASDTAASEPAAPRAPDTPFVPSFAVPESVQDHLPSTDRMHKIILQTAKYVRQAGGQTEFVLRVKQAGNANFSFLHPDDKQHAYFRWLVSTKPEDMLVIDAAPAAEASTSAKEAVGGQQSPEHSSPSAQPFSAHEQPAQSTVEPAATTSTEQSHAISSASQQETADSKAAVAVDPAAPSKVLPIADMAALARRIGMANKAASQAAGQNVVDAPIAHYAAVAPGSGIAQTVPSSRQAAATGSSSTAVPTEIQAIIHKLVHFIKKAGPKFEATVRNKEKANLRFAFLLPWNQYHSFYQQQLVEILGQAVADEVVALRAQLGSAATTAPQDAPATSAPTQSDTAAVSSSPEPSAAQAAADDLREEADAAIPDGSNLEQRLSQTESGQGVDLQQPGAGQLPLAAPSVIAVKADEDGRQAFSKPSDSKQPAALAIAESTEGDRRVQSSSAAAGSNQGQLVSKQAPAVTTVRSNPRFASKPVKDIVDAAANPSSPTASASAPATGAQASSAPAVEAAKHEAHAEPLSLEAVTEAQNALLHERQQQGQPEMTLEEKKAQRRKLARQMLEARLKSSEDAEEQKRKLQQSALAKYRQAFADDAEEEVIHLKLEDDEAYEAPEPGEIVDQPEAKPVSGPVLSAPPSSPLPSLETLIRPRQDLVPQQRMFPIGRLDDSKQTGKSTAEDAKPSTSDASSDEGSQEASYGRHKRKHKHSCRDSISDDSDSDNDRRRPRHRSKHRRESRHSSHRQSSRDRHRRSKHKKRRRRSRSSSSDQSSSDSEGKTKSKRSRADDSDTAQTHAANGADALRAKVRAMLGHI